jgi:hypothetical protein
MKMQAVSQYLSQVGITVLFKKIKGYDGHYLSLPKGIKTNFYVGKNPT